MRAFGSRRGRRTMLKIRDLGINGLAPLSGTGMELQSCASPPTTNKPPGGPPPAGNYYRRDCASPPTTTKPPGAGRGYKPGPGCQKSKKAPTKRKKASAYEHLNEEAVQQLRGEMDQAIQKL
jgi:hypothetical protein